MTVYAVKEFYFRNAQLSPHLKNNGPSLGSLISYLQQVNMYFLISVIHTTNANMVDYLVSMWGELHESFASQALMFCFDNASQENSCFVIDLDCFISLCL